MDTPGAPSVFECAYIYLLGMDTPGASDEELREYNEFYDAVHGPEVVAHNPGFVGLERYELVQPDRRNELGPRWLTVYGIADAASVETFVAGADGPPNPNYTARPPSWARNEVRWRLIWRRMAVPGGTGRAARQLAIAGLSSAAVPGVGGTSSEAADGGSAALVATYELANELRYPLPQAPTRLVIWEIPPGEPPIGGDVSDDTAWLLGYRQTGA